MKLTQVRLRELLSYDPETGEFRWKQSKGPMSSGQIAGHRKITGYRYISIDGKAYPAHHLAWFYVHGKFPIEELDHINRVKFDNRLINLRQATRTQNNQNTSISKNSTTGVKGVSYDYKSKKWHARIRYDGKTLHVGRYKTLEEAKEAIKIWRMTLHREFSNHG